MEFATAIHLATESTFVISYVGSVWLNTVSAAPAMIRGRRGTRQPPDDAGQSQDRGKRERIKNLMGLVNNNLLIRIVKEVQKTPEVLQEITSRSNLARLENEFLRDVGCTIALPLIEGGTFDWQIASLGKLMRFFINESPTFQQFLQTVYAQHPGTPADPWHLIIAEDELVPGAVLRLDNKKKMLAHYISFSEFPARARKHTSAWLPLAFIRTAVIKTCLGGTSGVERHLLRQLLVGDASVRMQGMVLPIGPAADPVLIFVVLGASVVDELAEKSLWSARGKA